MANSPKGSGNPLLPIAIIGVVVLAVLVGVFALRGEEPPDRETIIEDDRVEGVLGGTGSVPEGDAADAVGQAEPDRGSDQFREGITDQVDEVEPAADGVDSVPAADRIEGSGNGEGQSGGQAARTVNGESGDAPSGDSQLENQGDVRPVGTTTVDQAGAGGANAELSDNGAANRSDAPAASIVGGSSAAGDPLIDDESVGTRGAENVDRPAPSDTSTAQALPAGRDAQMNLNPSECQDIVRDTDTGGAPFIPTPAGPDANNRGECLDDPQQQPE